MFTPESRRTWELWPSAGYAIATADDEDDIAARSPSPGMRPIIRPNMDTCAIGRDGDVLEGNW